MSTDYSFIAAQDPEIYNAILGEEKREQEGLELIPSENYVSLAVRQANGSVFTNKYAEGYVGKRYYGGQEYVDVVERLGIERACELFNCKYANVQPLSGGPMNVAVYFGILDVGDTVLGMDLSHGGHLTHGHPVTHVAKVFNFVRYKMKDPDTGEIDYEALREVALREKPKLILAGFSAYTRELDYQKFVDIAKEVGAMTMMDASHIGGLIAGKACKNPFDYGFDIMTTTTHKSLRGPRGGLILTRDNEEIAKKIDRAVFPGLQGGPHIHTQAAKAIAFGEALKPSFHAYSLQILKNAKAMEAVFKQEKIRLLCGGTDNHCLLADVFGSIGITGGAAEEVLDEVGITLNKNSIADDVRSYMDPSGIRFGTPAITTRGFKEADCARVAELMIQTMRSPSDAELKKRVRAEIKEMCLARPVPEKFV
ncbi:MAG TPA: serine hydroxymethyltransferase [Candidatus Gracilibacteria bacterium]